MSANISVELELEAAAGLLCLSGSGLLCFLPSAEFGGPLKIREGKKKVGRDAVFLINSLILGGKENTLAFE